MKKGDYHLQVIIFRLNKNLYLQNMMTNDPKPNK